MLLLASNTCGNVSFTVTHLRSSCYACLSLFVTDKSPGILCFELLQTILTSPFYLLKTLKIHPCSSFLIEPSPVMSGTRTAPRFPLAPVITKFTSIRRMGARVKTHGLKEHSRHFTRVDWAPKIARLHPHLQSWLQCLRLESERWCLEAGLGDPED